MVLPLLQPGEPKDPSMHLRLMRIRRYSRRVLNQRLARTGLVMDRNNVNRRRELRLCPCSRQATMWEGRNVEESEVPRRACTSRSFPQRGRRHLRLGRATLVPPAPRRSGTRQMEPGLEATRLQGMRRATRLCFAARPRQRTQRAKAAPYCPAAPMVSGEPSDWP